MKEFWSTSYALTCLLLTNAGLKLMFVLDHVDYHYQYSIVLFLIAYYYYNLIGEE